MSLITASYFGISVKMDAVFQLLGATDVSVTKDSSWTSVENALMLTNVRETPVLVETVSTLQVPTSASVVVVTRAPSPARSAETLTNVYRMAVSATTDVVSTRMAVSTVSVMQAFM